MIGYSDRSLRWHYAMQIARLAVNPLQVNDVVKLVKRCFYGEHNRSVADLKFTLIALLFPYRKHSGMVSFPVNFKKGYILLLHKMCIYITQDKPKN